MTTVSLPVVAAISFPVLFVLGCAISLYIRKHTEIRISMSDVDPSDHHFTIQVTNSKPYPVIVREVGFQLLRKRPSFWRIHSDAEGEFRGASIEPGGKETWTLSSRLFKHPDFEGQGLAYIRLENGKRVKGSKQDFSPYHDSEELEAA